MKLHSTLHLLYALNCLFSILGLACISFRYMGLFAVASLVGQVFMFQLCIAVD